LKLDIISIDTTELEISRCTW